LLGPSFRLRVARSILPARGQGAPSGEPFARARASGLLREAVLPLYGVLRSLWEEGLEVGPTFLAPTRALLVARPSSATRRTLDTSPLFAQRSCPFAPPRRSRPTRRTGPPPPPALPTACESTLGKQRPQHNSKSTQQPWCGAQRSAIFYILQAIFRPRCPLRGCLPLRGGIGYLEEGELAIAQ
jgi:hypothetical protein